jgi:hypothetical protein
MKEYATKWANMFIKQQLWLKVNSLVKELNFTWTNHMKHISPTWESQKIINPSLT